MGQILGAGEGAPERLALDVALGGFWQVVVPDVLKGMVEADALEAVVKADRPVVFPGEGGEDLLGEVLEAGDLLKAIHERK